MKTALLRIFVGYLCSETDGFGTRTFGEYVDFNTPQNL